MISPDAFIARREQLFEKMEAGAILLLPAAPEVLRNGDAHYRYRQQSDFYYLTGFKEPEALVVLMAGASPKTILFNREKDPAMEVWTGPRAGQDGAKAELHIDEAYSINDIDQRLPELLENQKTLYFPMGNAAFEQQVMGWLKKTRSKVRLGVSAPSVLKNSDDLLNEMRVIKSAEEIDCMRKAAQISVAAHQRAMKACRPGLMEYQLHAELLHEFKYHGCDAEAYDGIVGGGKNACVLHYIDNQDALNDNELVLIDAGGEYQSYAADITRTFPINGRFSEAQKAIYNLVLKAQLATIDKIKPGLLWNDMQNGIVRILTEGLVELGLLQGDIDQLLEEKAYSRFYMHGSGHFLGLDVHDAGSYKIDGEWRPLQAGMVLTVEPGLYIAAGSEGVDEKWWHIGVRIEDDVLVTETGCEVLSGQLEKTVEDIEQLMQS